MNPRDIRPYHIHVEINTGTQDLETCDIRLYKVEESNLTEEEMSTETVCETSDEYATGGGPNIEGQGANPESDPGSPTRSLGGGGEGNNDDAGVDAEDQTTPPESSVNNPDDSTDTPTDDGDDS